MPEANSTGVGVMCWCNHSHPLPTLTPPPALYTIYCREWVGVEKGCLWCNKQPSRIVLIIVILYIVESGWVWKRGAYGVISNPRELF